MANFIDKLLKGIQLGDEDYDEEFEDEDEVIEPRRRFRDQMEEEEIRPQRSKIMQMPSNTRRSNRNNGFSSGMGVCVVRPKSVEDGQVIIDTLLDNRTVVVNLEGIDTGVAQRIMDITFGANVALDGHLQQISKSIFIVTPRSVDISGDFQEALASGYVDMFGIAK
ncbi:MAG: cell division protein SepF [Lachnospiraceae bacterium]|nr:cell division protein SepF [Lachnospiraceae bacterium]